jgi:catechol 2,3-dioxygenase-like lactoylglutathione lyase family enzyme
VESIHFLAVTPQFTVPDIARTVAYYRDVFGFQVAGYWDGERVTDAPGDDSVFAIVQRNKVQVFFSRGDGSAVRTGRAQHAYDAYFHVTGIDALAADFRSRGAEILDGPEDRSYGQRELMVQDCNGLILAFAEDTSGRAT